MSGWVRLKALESLHRDVGKGRARLSPSVLQQLGVSTGDIIEIRGKRSTGAIAWPLEDEEGNIVRIDGQTRKNAGVSINEFVRVRKAKVRDASMVQLAPISASIPTDREFADFIKNRVKGYPVNAGDEISIVILGTPIFFNVVSTRPPGLVRIDEKTVIQITFGKVERPSAPRVTYEEIGGLRDVISRLREMVELPLRHPELFQRLGIEPPKGILLYGPPGCGKTLLAKALANEAEAHFISISGPEIMSKYYGETEARLREIFKEARENAPCIIFIDEIDALAPSREETFGDVEKRVVAQLLALMDGMVERGQVVVIGATNRPELLDMALRRPGRFDREVEIGVPDLRARLEILSIHTRGMPLASDVNLEKLAEELHGYTGADIRALCQEAALKAVRRVLPDAYDYDKIPPELIEKIEVTGRDFEEARKEIIPSALREFYVERPYFTWEQVGGLANVKKTLEENLIWALKEPSKFERMGVTPPRGALLYGPPGCGKTMLARALAAEADVNMILVKGPEILNKWFGESEKAVRDIYRKARAAAPCIIILDEVDAIARARFGEMDLMGGERVLSQLLTEMDSVTPSTRIFTLATTNRPDLLDLALLRPGRLDVLIYVPPPNVDERVEILKILTAKMPLSKGFDITALAQATTGYTGADLQALCREAAMEAIRRGAREVTLEDFRSATQRVRPSITSEIETFYQEMATRLSKARALAPSKGIYG